MSNETRKYERGERIRFQPHDCTVCGKIHEPVILDAEKFYRWKGGECIQDVFPEMTKDQREILISGTCPECFKELCSRCAEEDLELENTDPSEIPHSGIEAERMERDRMDKINAGLELIRVREEYKWDQRELEQRAKDEAALDALEEEQRQKELEEWQESVEEWNSFYSTDPLNPGNGI